MPRSKVRIVAATCKICGTPFSYPQQKGRKRETCSPACSRRNHLNNMAQRQARIAGRAATYKRINLKVPYTCLVCGKSGVGREGKKTCRGKCKYHYTCMKRKRARDKARDRRPLSSCVDCGGAFRPFKTGDYRPCLRCFSCQEVKERFDRRVYQKARVARIEAGPVERFTSEEIFNRDGWICGICRKPVSRSRVFPHRMSATLDHIIPIAKGGPHTRRNVQCAHFSCNNLIRANVSGKQLLLIG